MSLGIKPSSGKLAAGGFVLFRVRLDAGWRAAVFDRDVVCKVTSVEKPKLDDDGEKGEMSSTISMDTYSEQRIPSEALSSRYSVVKSVRGRDKMHHVENFQKTVALYGENDDERLLNASMLEVAAVTNEQAHIKELKRRTSMLMHLRVVARTQTKSSLLRQHLAGRNHVRSSEIVAEEPEISLRSFTPIKGQSSFFMAPTISSEEHNDIGRALLTQVVRDTLNETAVRQAFEELRKPPIMLVDGSFPSEAEKEVEKDDSARTYEEAMPEFQALAESLMSETVFNLMQEAMHGMFDLTALPRQIVTKGYRVKGQENGE